MINIAEVRIGVKLVLATVDFYYLLEGPWLNCSEF